MRIGGIRIVCLCAVLAAASAVPVLAQALAQRFHIPFPFHAGKQLLPAGTYNFIQRAGSPRLEITNVEKKTVAMLPVITRVAARPGQEKGGRLVFDREREERFLSELWPTGMDGLVLRAAPERHEHESVEATTQ